MQPLTPVFGICFYIILVIISAVSFFLWRRLFRRLFKSETAVIIATAVAAMITAPVVFLLLLRIPALVANI